MKTSTTHVVYISIIVVLLLIMAGGFYYLHKKAESPRMGTMMQGMRQMDSGKGMPPAGMRGMMMTQVTPPPLSDQQTQQLQEGKSTATTQKTFNITGGNFYFVPNAITVNKGDTVTFVMTNAGGVHDIVIDELGVKTPVNHTAQAASVTFTASRAGSFVYYCDVMGHKAKGMWGTLTVL